MKKLQSPPRNAVRAESVVAKSMAAVLSVALMLGLTPAQALALAQEDAPALEQVVPSEEPGGQDSTSAETNADVSESTDAPESTEDSASDSSTDAAEEPAAPADAESQGVEEEVSSDDFATVLGSSSTGLALSSGETYELADIDYSFSGTVILKIREGGTYTFHGSRPNTQIQVDTDKDEPVTIVLSAVTIDNSGHDLSAISIEGDSQVTIYSHITSNLKGGAESESSSHAGAGIYVNHDAAVTYASDSSIVATGAAVSGTTQGKRAAGIGGAGSGHSDSGSITFEDGCHIQAYGATGEDGGTGIGSGYDGVCHDITIKGGSIHAYSGPGAAGIGSAAAHGTGNGGKVEGSIQILGGTVTAAAGDHGAGIGSGQSGDENGGITIRNATVTAAGGTGGAGIGSGDGGDSRGTVTIADSTVDATGGWGSAGIGSGRDGVSYGISISGDTSVINASGGTYGAGIGSGLSASAGGSLDFGRGGNQDGDISISGGTINAQAGDGGTPIGAAQGGILNGDINISGGNVNCIRKDDVAAIGAGISGTFNGTVTISGGKISSNAYSLYVMGNSSHGTWAEDGVVKITGGTVMLKCSNNEWSAPHKDQIVITGGSVYTVGSAATDGHGNAVYRVTLLLVDAATPITDISSNTSYASSKDIYPDGDGNIYVYLPLTAGTDNENGVYLNQEGKANHYRDNHTTDIYSRGVLKMDGKISFKQTDGTMTVGNRITVELDDSDPSWIGATWGCESEGAVDAVCSIDPSPGVFAQITATGTGSYSVTPVLKSSKYYWTSSGTFTGTVLEPASISLSSLTKHYDGKKISLGNLAKTDSDGRLSFIFEQLKDGAWQKVDLADVVGEGHYRVTATTERTDAYAAGTATQEFDILPASASAADTDAAKTETASKDAAARTASVTTVQVPQKSSLPNTGDETQPIAAMVLGALGAVAVAGALALRSRKNRS
ncbi:MAG: LPXTG cell wall anchor domain-containing protein [Atopobiaceae bacterium]